MIRRLFKTLGLNVNRLVTLGLIAILMWYFIPLLFGERSVLVLFSLREQREDLQNQIERYKKENANLQRDYFKTLGVYLNGSKKDDK